VSDDGEVRYEAEIGFAAIGTGAFAALNMLYFYGRKTTASLPAAIYHTCESKFMAESADGVGESTFAFVLHKSGDCTMIWPDHVEQIRLIWKNEGQPRAPRNINELVSHQLEQPKNREKTRQSGLR
jgi:hypothetical protein